MNLIPSASGRLCCCKTESNRVIKTRLEECKRYAPPGFVLALLLAVITSPVTARAVEFLKRTYDLEEPIIRNAIRG